jgi:hypothetical protein
MTKKHDGLELKIFYENLFLSDLHQILKESDLILKNIVDIFSFSSEEKGKLPRKFQVKDISKGSIELLLALGVKFALAIKVYNFIITELIKSIRNTYIFIQELKKSLENLAKLFSEISKSTHLNFEKHKKLEESQKILSKKVSLINHIFNLSKICYDSNYKLILAYNRQNVIIDDKTFNFLRKNLPERIYLEEPIEICGYIEKMEAKSKPYKISFLINDNIRLTLFLSSEILFNQLKEYFTPRKNLKIKLQIKLFIDIKQFKKADKGEIIKLLGKC